MIELLLLWFFSCLTNMIGTEMCCERMMLMESIQCMRLVVCRVQCIAGGNEAHKDTESSSSPQPASASEPQEVRHDDGK